MKIGDRICAYDNYSLSGRYIGNSNIVDSDGEMSVLYVMELDRHCQGYISHNSSELKNSEYVRLLIIHPDNVIIEPNPIERDFE